jgi:hypothetical protein
MADYYPLIARAVAGLEKSTGEGRRALYERARNALVAQLRGVTPALSESDITRERLALEEAIRKVEGEAARRSRHDVPRFEPKAPRPKEPERHEERAAPATQPSPLAPEPQNEPSPPEAAEPPTPRQTARPAARHRSAGERVSLTDEGLKDFRDVVADAEHLGGAATQASRAAREVFAAVPAPSPAPREPERREPGLNHRLEEERLRSLVREPAPEHPAEPEPPPMLEPAINVPDSQPAPPRRLAEPAPEPPPQHERPVLPQRSYRGLIKIVILLLLVLGASATAYLQRDKLKELYALTQTKPAPTPARNSAAPARPKIADRITPSGPATPATPPAAKQQKPAAAAVAQRAVLYEEDASNPQGKRFLGSVIWRTETVSSGPNQSPDLAIRADVEVPERRLAMTFSLRRNADQALPASHTIEIMLNLPAAALPTCRAC